MYNHNKDIVIIFQIELVTSLTLHGRAVPVGHHDVHLQEELGRALQERLKQLEHTQVGGHVEELAVLASHLFFFLAGGRFGPEHPVAAL